MYKTMQQIEEKKKKRSSSHTFQNQKPKKVTKWRGRGKERGGTKQPHNKWLSHKYYICQCSATVLTGQFTVPVVQCLFAEALAGTEVSNEKKKQKTTTKKRKGSYTEECKAWTASLQVSGVMAQNACKRLHRLTSSAYSSYTSFCIKSSL